jgi:hypothetical protein
MRAFIAFAALVAVAVAPQIASAAAAGMAMSAKLAAPAGITSSGTGTATLSLDPASKVLTYTVTYSGLTGPATAAHIHAAAAPGGNGRPVVPFANPASPISGTVTLTDAQIADLHNGLWYVNVHTAANGGGEIRGNIVMGN